VAQMLGGIADQELCGVADGFHDEPPHSQLTVTSHRRQRKCRSNSSVVTRKLMMIRREFGRVRASAALRIIIDCHPQDAGKYTVSACLLPDWEVVDVEVEFGPDASQALGVAVHLR